MFRGRNRRVGIVEFVGVFGCVWVGFGVGSSWIGSGVVVDGGALPVGIAFLLCTVGNE